LEILKKQTFTHKGEKVARIMLKNLFIFILMLILTVILPKYAFAEFKIEVTPYQGGQELIFRAQPLVPNQPQEIKVKITTDIHKRYEVRQIALEPPDNYRGTVIDWRNFSLYGLLGSLVSSSPGTLHVANSVPTSTLNSLERIYTSSQEGASAEFILVYNLNLTQQIPQGMYRGRIKFVLVPLEGGASEVEDFLNVVVEVGTTPTEAKPQIEITPVSGLNTIYLNSGKEDKKTFDVEVRINKDFSKPVILYQVVVSWPECSQTGEKLPSNALNYQVKQINKGKSYADRITDFSSARMNLYASDPNGTVDNYFVITYGLGDLFTVKAGRYKGTIYYYLENAGYPEFLGRLDLEIENERIFELVIIPEEQKSVIEFRNLNPKEAPKRSEVIIEIKTNLGKPYQVNQNILSELTDKEGNVIPFKYFTVDTESLDTKGKLKITGKQAAQKGETILFVSDEKGSADKFKIIYELSTDWKIKAGDYSTRITYSLLEI